MYDTAHPFELQLIVIHIVAIFSMKSAKKLVGITPARIAFYIYFTNKFYNVYVIRCLGNSVESILTLIMLNFFMDIKSSFDINISIFTIIAVISIMIRCTSVLGWMPLILYKICN